LANIASPQGSPVRVLGTIIDSNGRAIQFANVKALPNGNRVIAGTDGRFSIQVDPSVKAIEIRRIGFEPKVVNSEAWSDSALTISLTALPAKLERVRIEAEQQVRSLTIRGFYERQTELENGINHGFMITPEEIDQRKGARVTDFLLGHPGVKVATVKPPRPYDQNARVGLQPQGSGNCRMEIYVDGIRFYTKGPKDPLRHGDLGDLYINDQIPTTTIAAMEVYPRAVGAPPKYQTLNGDCGVILIWTK
jgi:hypothetical protein